MRIVQPGQGEVVGDSPTRRVEILCDHDAVHATVSRFAAGQDGADLHIHRRHHDLFYVLEGELTLRLQDAEDLRAGAGTLVCVPPLVVHGFRNGSDADVRYLNLHAPGARFADYMRSLRDGAPIAYDQFDPPADGGRPVSEAVAGVESIRIDAVEVAPLGAGGTAVAGDRVASFYVLGGEAEFALVDGAPQRCGAGTWVQAPAGVGGTVTPAPGARLLAILT